MKKIVLTIIPALRVIRKSFLKSAKCVVILLIVAVMTAGCDKTMQEDKNGEEPQVSGVNFTPCLQTKVRNTVLSSVDVAFTNEGVQITYNDFEVTCDFTAVNVTHTFVNGVLDITQQGSPNDARCLCYTDVSYTINGISQNEVNVIFINGVQVYCYNSQTENSLAGKWLASNYHAGDCDTIVFMENFYVQQYFDYIFANQVIPAMYIPPFVTYSLLDDNITFTIHQTYPIAECFEQTFKYILNGNSLTIKGFSNPFSLTKEARSDVHFTKIEEISKPVEEGTYTGIFTVTYLVDMPGSWADSGSRQTTLELKDGKFTNTGNHRGGGSGNYSIESNKIIFEDLNFWTADFDGNMILNGEYEYTFDGKRLKFYAYKNDVGYYEYDLVKESSNYDKDVIIMSID